MSSFLLVLIPTILYGIVDIETFIGFFIRISIAGMIIFYFKNQFFHYFENLIFILALISLPLYFIQIVNIHFFEYFRGFSELVLSEERLTNGQEILSGHRYLVVFLVNSWGEKRNSGFGWEPAVFGAILCWAILINLFINHNRINSKLIILFVAALSTFSIGTFISLIVIYIFIIINSRQKIKYIVSGIIIILIISSLTYFIDTMQRFDNYIEETQEQAYLTRDTGNRIDGFIYGMEFLLKRPWGYGIRSQNPDVYMFPNGFINLVLRFGILGLITILVLLQRQFRFLNLFYSAKFKGSVLFVIAIVITLNGNPLSFQEIMFTFLLSGYILLWNVSKKHIRENINTHKFRI